MNKKITTILIILAIIVAGSFIYLNDYNRIEGLKQGVSELETMNGKLYASLQDYENKGDLQTYKNGTYGFEFIYPASLRFITPIYPNLEDKILQLQIPQSDYPKTNFGDAAFSVSASYAKSLSDCLAQSSPENGDGFKTSVQINGTTFYKTNSAGVGAGNLYEATNYRALVGGQTCVELTETIHTANINNYTPGTVTEVNKAAVQTRLDQILNTFKLE